MSAAKLFIGVFAALFTAASPVWAGSTERGTIFTLWPLIDYRTSPAENFENLSLLGPLIKIETKGAERETAIRPFLYDSTNVEKKTSTTDFLYPAASRESTPEADSFRAFGLFQKTTYHKDEPQGKEEGTTLFPFYISGTSKKYGPYRSVFPLYGDLYQRFWRDEYHFVLFPLYGRTVNNGTTTNHYLYPFFSRTHGDKESGFAFFPLYGQAEKEGVYRKHYLLWPLLSFSETGLDGENPTKKRAFFPLFAATDSPRKVSRSYLWPLFGYEEDRVKKTVERDYLWPLVYTVRGERRDSVQLLPLWGRDTFEDGEKRWYLWPLYKHEELRSEMFHEDRDRILFFLYSDRRKFWPKDGSTDRRTAFWPLFLYKSTPHGVSSISVPAPVEPILDKDGIERDWAPLWRIYLRRWNENGDSASSFLWNLFWHERRGDDLAFELFPLVSYRGEKEGSDLKLFKGLFGLSRNGAERELSLLWLPGLKWGGK